MAAEEGNGMTSWGGFVEQAPRLGAYAAERFADEATGRLTYISTVRKDGGPRVHPVKVFPAGEGLFLFMYPDSPKGYDLQRDPRIALHAAVTPNPFASGELAAHGTASIVEDARIREAASAVAPFAEPPAATNVLYAIDLDFVMGAFVVDGAPLRLRWRSADGIEEDIGFGGRTS